MPKYFVTSDVHGFYNEFMTALDNAGYNPEDENHWVIICGDLFDRGPGARKLLTWALKTPRTIFIRGNHEDLFEDCCNSFYPSSADQHNGTTDTIRQLCQGVTDIQDWEEDSLHAMAVMKPYLDKTVNYFETKNYVFVHGYIPCITERKAAPWYQRGYTYAYKEDWREAHASEWKDARWYNGFEVGAAYHVTEPYKTIVFGHWHTSWAREKIDLAGDQWADDADFSIYYGDGFIGLDGCTAETGLVNILVVEDEPV